MEQGLAIARSRANSTVPSTRPRAPTMNQIVLSPSPALTNVPIRGLSNQGSFVISMQQQPSTNTPVLIRQVSVQQESTYMPAHIPSVLQKQQSLTVTPSIIYVQAPEHVTTLPDAVSTHTKHPLVEKCFCCVSLRSGYLGLSIINMMISIACLILAILGHLYTGQWAYGLLIASSLICIILDVYGFYGGYQNTLRVVKRYAMFQWIRIIINGLIYITIVAVSSSLPYLFGLIALVAVEGYFGVCIWSFYMDLRDRPEKYGQTPHLSSLAVLQQLAPPEVPEMTFAKPEEKTEEKRGRARAASRAMELGGGAVTTKLDGIEEVERRERKRSRAASRAMELGNVVVFS
ncbi:hypothetical protein BC829DRAFT_487119 [Chytridium lagenaria]|nr:hypothetical protein BC829DRAFT_487119 [Chytridium lagenaria]